MVDNDFPLRRLETVLALTLVLLLIFIAGGQGWALYAAMAVLAAGMTVPRLFGPAARCWFGFSHILGAVMSRLLMGVLFFVLITPIGLFRRLCGKDILQLRGWRKGSDSVFQVREHRYTERDLQRPY